MTFEFLEYLKLLGNDLCSPSLDAGFPGLKPGDCWCVCAQSWAQAFAAGKACPVALESTHAKALLVVPIEALMTHALDHCRRAMFESVILKRTIDLPARSLYESLGFEQLTTFASYHLADV